MAISSSGQSELSYLHLTPLHPILQAIFWGIISLRLCINLLYGDFCSGKLIELLTDCTVISGLTKLDADFVCRLDEPFNSGEGERCEGCGPERAEPRLLWGLKRFRLDVCGERDEDREGDR